MLKDVKQLDSETDLLWFVTECSVAARVGLDADVEYLPRNQAHVREVPTLIQSKEKPKL